MDFCSYAICLLRQDKFSGPRGLVETFFGHQGPHFKNSINLDSLHTCPVKVNGARKDRVRLIASRCVVLVTQCGMGGIK